ncbi:5-hydroxyisourate hydrolase [Anopheles coustani]|uniref:5-hydroxyisourate hydrolase n=1 Tax=Anopheles coustani TaxID=139045 RepID=UPI0026586A09|nr:5-hydroxyisourate hydrolase [Anopheles coustani]
MIRPIVRTRHPLRLLAAVLVLLELLIARSGSVAQAAAASAVKISAGSDSTMQNLSTHILDTSRGKPAPEVPITLYRQQAGGQAWTKIGAGITDGDGRFREFFATDGPQPGLQTGVYKLHFEVGSYFRSRSVESLYPFIEVVFAVADPTQHYHIPLLLNPFGYSTYRGS